MKKYKRQAVSLALAFSMVSSIPVSVKAASDISKHWAESYITYLMDNNIVHGYTDGTFKPDQEVTRSEFIRMVNNLFKYEAKQEVSFKDVEENVWYYEDLKKAVKAGYIQGHVDGTFKPLNPITRQEVAKIVTIALGLEHYQVKEEADYKDRAEIPNWSRNYIDIVSEKGIMNGHVDGSFKATKEITRGEVAKILALLDQNMEKLTEDPFGDKPVEKPEDKPEETPEEKPEEKPSKVYSVQLDSFTNKNQAIESAKKAYKLGYKDTFVASDDYKFYFVIVNDFDNLEEANKLIDELKAKKESPLLIRRDFKKLNTFKIEDYIKEEEAKSKRNEFIKLVDSMPAAKDITVIKIEDVKNLTKARDLYKNLSESDKKSIGQAKVDKLNNIDRKIESLKTPIKTKTKASIEQAQVWAIKKGAHKRFVDVAPFYWKYGELTGINPEILYGQAAKETAYGRYTGKVKPEMNNWAGIKTDKATGDKTYDHEIFDTPEDGVRAQFNHMGIYVGVDPIGEPHGRWYLTSKISWAGTVLKVEDLGGKWAPNPDYGISIMRDYTRGIYNTKVNSKEDLKIALEFSDRVENLDSEGLEDLEEIEILLKDYEELTKSQKDLLPYNIRDIINQIN